MIRFFRTFGYMWIYLAISLPSLKRKMKQAESLPVKESDRLLHQLPKHWAKGIMKRTQSSITIKGLENLPDEPVLLVANHEGNFDIPLLISHLPIPFGFMAKAELNKMPGIRSWMAAMNCVMVDRSNRRSAMQSIGDSITMLKNGHSLLIFPEGTRSKGTGLAAFKQGASKIAREAGVPVVPIAIHGTSVILEQAKAVTLNKSVVTVTIEKPIPAEEVQSLNGKELTEKMHAMIQAALQNEKKSR